jgi:hypothetical protein
MLLAILYIYQNTASTDFLLLSLSDINFEYQKILWLSLSFRKRNMTCRLLNSSNSTLNFGTRSRNEELYCKSLVVYLSPDSLGSTLKYKNFSSGLREMCNIPMHLDSILLGVLLSDG